MITVLVGQNGSGKTSYMRSERNRHPDADMLLRGDQFDLEEMDDSLWYLVDNQSFHIFAIKHFELDVRVEALRGNTRLYIDGQHIDDPWAGLTAILQVAFKGWLAVKYKRALFLEHPDAGLHPRVHAQLANMVMACSAAGSPVFVETHSEALVSHVCELVEAGRLPPAEVAVLRFVRGQKPAQHAVGLDGTIADWPIGFLT